jgi:hypothetical protein
VKNKKLVAAVSAGVLALGLTLTAAAPAMASTYRGGVSVWNACVYQNGTPSWLQISPNNVTGWGCVYSGGWNQIVLGVNLNKECAREYGSGTYAAYTNFNDPYSWGCYR